MRFFIIVVVLLFFSGCNKNKFSQKELDIILSDFSQEDLKYFSEIVFNSDRWGKTKLKRWKKEIKIRLYGEYSKRDSIYIEKVILSLNSIIEDPQIKFSIEEKSNLKLYFISRNNFTKFHKDAVLANGFVCIHWNIFVGITDGYILIDKDTKGNLRDHIILEEITQSLGLIGDSERYPSSLFYQLYSENVEYSKIDLRLIKLLYNYNLPIGITEQKFEGVFINNQLEVVPLIPPED